MKCQFGHCRRPTTWYYTWVGNHYCGHHLHKVAEKAREESLAKERPC
jgi:hypothetical protein